MRVNSKNHGRKCTCLNKQSNSCQEDNTQADNRKDTDTRRPTEFNETNSNNCISQLMSCVVCARSGCLHTICSDIRQRRRFHHYISDCRLTILGRTFHTDRIDRAAVQTILADLISTIPHHSQKCSTQSPDLGHLLMMLELFFHWT